MSTINKKKLLINDMTYNEKMSLYESIMKEVAKTVKRQINEASSSKPLTDRLKSIKDKWEDMSSEAKTILLSCIDRIIEFDEKGDKEKLKNFKKAINPF